LEHAAQHLLEQIQINPVIAAVCNEDELALALASDCRVVFLLMGNVLDIGELTRRVHESGKLCVIHLDLIDGLSSKEIAVDAIQKATNAEGIISTRGALIRRAKQIGMAAIQCLVAIWVATSRTHWFWRALVLWAAVMMMHSSPRFTA